MCLWGRCKCCNLYVQIFLQMLMLRIIWIPKLFFLKLDQSDWISIRRAQIFRITNIIPFESRLFWKRTIPVVYFSWNPSLARPFLSLYLLVVFSLSSLSGREASQQNWISDVLWLELLLERTTGLVFHGICQLFECLCLEVFHPVEYERFLKIEKWL